MKGKVNASFTVEATFIMPIVLFIIIFIIYLSFYLHDYCKVQNVVDRVLHKAAMGIKHEGDIGSGKVNYEELNKGLLKQMFERPDSNENEIIEYTASLLSKGLIVTRVNDIHVSKDVWHISIRVEGEFQLPIKGLQWLNSMNNTFLIEGKSAYHNPANYIRMSDVILDTGSRIKGFDNIKETIGKLIPD